MFIYSNNFVYVIVVLLADQGLAEEVFILKEMNNTGSWFKTVSYGERSVLFPNEICLFPAFFSKLRWELNSDSKILVRVSADVQWGGPILQTELGSLIEKSSTQNV